MHQPTFPRPPIVKEDDEQIPGQMTIDEYLAELKSEESDE